MRTGATGAFIGGVMMIIHSGTFLVRSKMMEHRESDRLHELGRSWRQIAGPSFWVGVFLLLLALALFLLSVI